MSQIAVSDLWCASCGKPADELVNIVGVPTPLCYQCRPPDDYIQAPAKKEDDMTTIEASTTIDTTESQLTPEADTNGHATETTEPVTGAKRTRKPRVVADTEPATVTQVSTSDIVEQIRAARQVAMDRREGLLNELHELDEQLVAVGVSFPESTPSYATPAEVPSGMLAARSIPVRKARTATTKMAATRTPRKTSERAPKRSKSDMQASCDKIVALLQKKGALKTEAIREALDIPKASWLTTAKHLKADKRVKVSGEKRATSWSAR